jgi:hypothetical protein
MNIITVIREIAEESQRKTDIIKTIAQVKLSINLDSPNLHSLSSENIRIALESAFKAGCKTGLTLQK